jgi:hypothetical protein
MITGAPTASRVKPCFGGGVEVVDRVGTPAVVERAGIGQERLGARLPGSIDDGLDHGGVEVLGAGFLAKVQFDRGHGSFGENLVAAALFEDQMRLALERTDGFIVTGRHEIHLV